MNKDSLIQQYKNFVIPTYTRSNLVVYKAKGSKVWDISGKEYIDFFPGWAVSGIGHCHPQLVNALKKQLDKVIHVPNNYYNEYQGRLAQKLIESSFPGKVFFCNSGAEAVESAIKLARRFGDKSKRYKVITMDKSFHGRTTGALSATGQEKYKKGFGELLKDFQTVPFNDIDALKSGIDKETVAVLLEPIQGEGGINIADESYLSDVRSLCDENDVLLIFDEVQTGMGRTGKLFCYQNYNIVPDIIALAKSLGGGVPIGAIIAGEKCSDVLQPGTHASTFGGSPLACVAALETLNIIKSEDLTKNAVEMGVYFKKKLIEFKKKFDFIKQVRGKGLMIAMTLNIEGKNIADECMKNGLLINCTQGNIIRLLPAININKELIDKGLDILYKVLDNIKN